MVDFRSGLASKLAGGSPGGACSEGELDKHFDHPHVEKVHCIRHSLAGQVEI